MSSTALSRFGAGAKARRTDGVVAKGGRRDAVQVLANGGAFAVAAAGALVHSHALWAAVGAGALAAATADTWATEIGTLRGAPPRSILTGRPVPTGTSGGVSLAGSLAAVAGAAFVAALARLLALPAPAAAVVAGGVAGALADSLLGATLQARRRCPRCGLGTERIVHGCGTGTVEAGGLTWMDNDVVNLLATIVGASVAALLARP